MKLVERLGLGMRTGESGHVADEEARVGTPFDDSWEGPHVATLVGSRPAAEGIRKEAEALGKMGGDAYVKMQVARQFAQKKILIVPGSNVSTMNVNELVDYLVGRAAAVGRLAAAGPSGHHEPEAG